LKADIFGFLKNLRLTKQNKTKQNNTTQHKTKQKDNEEAPGLNSPLLTFAMFGSICKPLTNTDDESDSLQEINEPEAPENELEDNSEQNTDDRGEESRDQEPETEQQAEEADAGEVEAKAEDKEEKEQETQGTQQKEEDEDEPQQEEARDSISNFDDSETEAIKDEGPEKLPSEEFVLVVENPRKDWRLLLGLRDRKEMLKWQEGFHFYTKAN